VQRPCPDPSGNIVYVSILTRPWGRVQRCNKLQIYLQLGCFNPHPPLGAGATERRIRRGLQERAAFQSSPAPGGGCNGYDGGFPPSTIQQFQSSPAPGGGCNGDSTRIAELRRLQHVSILTRPWGRVQHERCRQFPLVVQAFQSSPAPGGGCNLGWSFYRLPRTDVSILTRPWGRVQRRRQGC